MTNEANYQFTMNDRDRRLRKTFERLILRRMIDQLHADDLKPEMLCKMLHTYCELKKNDIAAEKVQSTARTERRRPSGSQDQASITATPRWEDAPLPPPHDRTHPDAATSSHDDFHRHLHDAIAEIYRINEPKNVLPPTNQRRNPVIRGPPAR